MSHYFTKSGIRVVSSHFGEHVPVTDRLVAQDEALQVLQFWMDDWSIEDGRWFKLMQMWSQIVYVVGELR